MLRLPSRPPSRHSPRRGRGLGPVVLALSVALLLGAGGGCLAPRKGQDVHHRASLEEVGQALLEGARPVPVAAEEGAAPLEADPYALADPGSAPVQEALETSEEEEVEPGVENPYLRFGERIILRSEGEETYITKPYTMPPGKAKKVLELMAALEPFPFRPRPPVDPAKGAAPLDPAFLEYQLLEKWDQEYYSDLEASIPKGSTPVVLSDVLIVTATYPMLERFEEFLDLFAAAGVPQIELEAKIIEVVETDTSDIGFDTSFAFDSKNFVKALDFPFSNLTTGVEALATLGAVQDDVTFEAFVDLLQTWDNVQISSEPRTVVRAGGVASIESTTDIPFFEIKTLAVDGTFTTNTVYRKIGIELYISPRIVGTKTMALEVRLIGSQQVGARATLSAGGTVVEVPEIASRTAKTVVYLEPGQTLIIGGLTQNRDREIVNKVPVLGDLPWLGQLFRSTFTQREKQTVLFAISPRILQRSDFQTEF